MTSRCTLLAAALIASCADAAAEPDAGAPPIDGTRGDGAATMDAAPVLSPEEAYFEELDRVSCRIAVTCEGRDAWFGDAPFARCHPAYVSRARRALLAAIRAGLVHFDPEAARVCLESYALIQTCGQRLSGLFRPDVVECSRIFAGALREGNACSDFFAGECAPGLYCRLSDECPGRCASPGTGGESCTSLFECAYDDDIVCSSEGICSGPPRIGDPCESAIFDCESLHVRLRCVDGACAALAGEGESCGDHYDCADGLACESMRCTRLPHDESACALDEPCVSLPATTEGTWCYRDDWFFVCPPAMVCAHVPGEPEWGWCLRGVPEGASCAPEAPCAPGLRCVDSRCARVVTPGAPCGLAAVCPITHFCDARTSTCAPLPVVGEPCGHTGRCAQGHCIDAMCALVPSGTECEGRARIALGECEGYCDDTDLGWCREREPLGAECRRDDECAAGLACQPPYGYPKHCAPDCVP